MSDPVTSVDDVEDVLSSIRRLVTDTTHEVQSADTTVEEVDNHGEKPADETNVSDALILTSALRIDDGGADMDDAPAQEASDAVTPVLTVLSSLRKSLSGEKSETSSEVVDESVSFEDSDDNSATDDTVFELPKGRLHLLSAESVVDTVESFAADTSDEYYEDEIEDTQLAPIGNDISSSEDSDEFSQKEFVDEEALVEDNDAHEDADQTEGDVSEDWDDDDQPAEAAENAEYQAEQPEFEENSVDEHAGEGETHAEGQDVEEHHAEEVDVEEHHETEEHDSGTGSEDEGIYQEASEHHDAETDVEADHDNADEHSAGETIFASSALVDDRAEIDLADLEDAVIDEDMLRDLVADIVRQELSGAMGERITRNVRKLVRREIHRALVTREFE